MDAVRIHPHWIKELSMRTLLDKLYEAYFWLSIAAYAFGLWMWPKDTHCIGCGCRLVDGEQNGLCMSCGAW